MKGYKTYASAIIVAVIGFLTSAEIAPLVTKFIEEHPGEWTVILAAVFAGLRTYTSTPPLKKD